MFRWPAIFVLVWLASHAVFAEDDAPLVIVHDGQPRARIVLSATPTAIESFAASELQHYVAKATGATLEITSDGQVADGQAVLCIGRNRFSESLAESLDASPVDTIVLQRRGRRVLLLGRDTPEIDPRQPGRRALDCERGTLNAVYEFLERFVGVRWYWPGRLGEVVPASDELSVGELNTRFSPSFIYRNSHQSQELMDPVASKDDLHLWWLRQRLGGVVGNATANHSFNDYPARFGRQHPEWFALQADGERLNTSGPWGGHVCFSDAGLFKQTVEDLVDYFRENPTQKFHAVMPGDGLSGHICQCELCQAQLEPQMGSSGRYSMYVWGFVNRVAREVGKQYPDRVVTCCAYGGYKDVPAGIDFEPNVSVTLCRNVAGSGGNYECYRNAEARQLSNEQLQAWSEAVSNVYIWDYHNLRWNRMMKGVAVIAPHGIAEELRHDARAGVKGHIIEYNTISYYQKRTQNLPHAWENWLMDAVNIYASFKLLWNVDADVDQMQEEFYDLFFGPAKDPMRDFFSLLEMRWMQTPLPLGGVVSESPANAWLHVYPKDVVERLFSHLDEARRLAGDSVYGQRIARLGADFAVMREKSRQWSLAKTTGTEAEWSGDGITNGGFESVTDAGLLAGPWDAMNAKLRKSPEAFSISAEKAHTGKRSLRIDAGAYGDQVATMNYVIAASNEEYRKYLGKYVKLTYYVYHESGELTLTTHVRLFQQKPGEPREYCNSIVSVRSVPVVPGQWTKVEKMGVVPYYDDIVTLDVLIGLRHSGADPPVVYFDDFDLTPISGDGGY